MAENNVFSIDDNESGTRGIEPLQGSHSNANVNAYKEYVYGRNSNIIQKCTIFLVIVVVAILLILIGVTSATYNKVNNFKVNTVTVAYPSLGNIMQQYIISV